DALGLLDGVDLDVDAEAGGPDVGAWGCVAAHDGGSIGDEVRVDDPVLPVGPDRAGHGRLAEGHDRLDLAAEDLLVEPERLGALAVEAEVGEDLHRVLLRVNGGWGVGRRAPGSCFQSVKRSATPA